MISKKYELIASDVKGLYRVKALRAFSGVKAGDVGGYVAGEYNLSHDGDCWVYDDAVICGNAWVSGNAAISGYACVYNNARVSGNACVSGNAHVSGNARVADNAHIYGDAHVYGSSKC